MTGDATAALEPVGLISDAGRSGGDIKAIEVSLGNAQGVNLSPEGDRREERKRREHQGILREIFSKPSLANCRQLS